jgi:hypothetical protein
MKTKNNLLRTVLTLLALITLNGQLSTALAESTAFTYQGRLNQAGAPYSGNAEFQATLWDAASGGAQVAASNPAAVTVGVTNGLFVMPLDFGAAPFAGGSNRWLQLEVRIALGPFTPLTPRQALTPTPYALSAGNLSGTLPAAQLSGTIASANLAGAYASAITLSNAANSFSASTWARDAPPTRGFTTSSSGHAHPLSCPVSMAQPLNFRSMEAGSKITAPLSRTPSCPSGHPSQSTRTGYMRSTGNPRAQNSRVAATSAYTSPFSRPNFTLTSSSGGMTQVNFGELPLIGLSRCVQRTVSSGVNDPCPFGPVRMSIDATSVASHTWARCIASRRAASEKWNSGFFALRPPRDAHAVNRPAAITPATDDARNITTRN